MSRAESFGDYAGEYDRYRPDYPADLWDHLLREAPGRAVDLGCGTGRATLDLARRGVDTIGVDPDPRMARQARAESHRSALPLRPRFLVARAEKTGLVAGRWDLITAAQSFHWFDPAAALAEARRLLRPGGRLALFWNDRRTDESPFLQEYERLVLRFNPEHSARYRSRDFARIVRESGEFDEVTESFRPDRRTFTPEGFVGYARTVSYIRGVLDAEALEAFEAELRDRITRHFGSGDLRLPYGVRLIEAR